MSDGNLPILDHIARVRAQAIASKDAAAFRDDPSCSSLFADTQGELALQFPQIEGLSRDEGFRMKAAMRVAALMVEIEGKHGDHQKLELKQCEIGDTQIIALSSKLGENTSVKYLDFSMNNVSDRGMEALGEALEVNRTLTNLKANGNFFTDRTAISFGRVLTWNPCLMKIDLSHRGCEKHLVPPGCSATTMTPHGAMVIAKALCSKTCRVESLSLGSHKFQDGGAIAFGKHLPDFTSLKMLCLRSCSISDLGGQQIASGLWENQKLETLDLSFNELKPEVIQSLKMAVKMRYKNFSVITRKIAVDGNKKIERKHRQALAKAITAVRQAAEMLVTLLRREAEERERMDVEEAQTRKYDRAKRKHEAHLKYLEDREPWWNKEKRKRDAEAKVREVEAEALKGKMKRQQMEEEYERAQVGAAKRAEYEAQEEKQRVKEEAWRKKREAKRQIDLVEEEQHKQAMQEQLEVKVEQALREWDELCRPGGKEGLGKSKKKIARSAMRAAAEAAAVAAMAACTCSAMAAEARTAVGANPGMFGPGGRTRRKQPRGAGSSPHKRPETESEDDKVGAAAAAAAAAEDEAAEVAAQARAEVKATQEQFSEARRGKGTTPWQLKFEHLMRDRDQIGESISRRRDVKKKRKQVEKEETKKMFADFEEEATKEEARKERRKEARKEAVMAAKKTVAEVHLPILGNKSKGRVARVKGGANRQQQNRQQKATVVESRSLPELANAGSTAKDRLARALAMM
jgi:hypothetical protein